MVDKIDRPDPPPSYAVTASAETKKDRPHEERHPEEEIARYQKEVSSKGWEKFQAETTAIKTLLVPTRDIRQVLFHRALSRQGSLGIEARLILQDGHVFDRVIFLLPHREDFLKIRLLKSGDVLPEIFGRFGTTREVGIPQSINPRGSWRMRQIEPQQAAKPQPATFWQRPLVWFTAAFVVFFTLYWLINRGGR